VLRTIEIEKLKCSFIGLDSLVKEKNIKISCF
jgi:hypothetical protein